VDYRPKTNAEILLDTVIFIPYTLRENTYRRNRERKGNLKLKSV
jgi:hypothetical protein